MDGYGEIVCRMPVVNVSNGISHQSSLSILASSTSPHQSSTYLVAGFSLHSEHDTITTA